MARPTPSHLEPKGPSLPGVSEEPQGARLRVRVTPRARRDAIVELESNPIRLKLAAAPVDGAANQALIKYLALLLGVPRGGIEIVSGARSRTKTLRIRGVDARKVSERLVSGLRSS